MDSSAARGRLGMAVTETVTAIEADSAHASVIQIRASIDAYGAMKEDPGLGEAGVDRRMGEGWGLGHAIRRSSPSNAL